MVVEEKLKQKGTVEIVLRDKKGNVVEKRKAENMIVSSGKTLIANLFRGYEKQAVSHIAVGTGTRIPTIADTGLEKELSPRKTFDKNIMSEEKSAFLTLQSEAGKDVLLLTAKESGEKGNNLKVKVNKGRGETITILVADVRRGEEAVEEFEHLSMDEDNKNYILTTVNEKSNLISIELLDKTLPTPTEDWVQLSGGSDAVVTLSATFDYDDCNGVLREAGIFNANEKGTMYNRVIYPDINKTNKLTLTLIWRIAF